MNSHVEARPRLSTPGILDFARAAALETLGAAFLRYSLVAVLVLFGALKFTAFEAEAIKPLVSNSPLMAWLYSLLSDQGASRLIGIIELASALLMAARPVSARASAIGSLLAVGTFLTTLSFLFSTPGALSAMHPANGFLLKDVVLLAAALSTGAEALRAEYGVRRAG